MSELAQEILLRLNALANPTNVAGMARYGINPQNTLGVSIPVLRQIAKETGRDHQLAQELWASGIHEARILAVYLEDSKQVTDVQMERWVSDLDSWDVCDQLCNNLFDRLPFSYAKALEWSTRQETFIKRAGFVLMATLAVHNKHMSNDQLEQFLTIILREATDERNYVKKSVNWALRQIGKRNRALNQLAIQTATQIGQIDDMTARWIASDALRELTSEKIQSRFKD